MTLDDPCSDCEPEPERLPVPAGGIVTAGRQAWLTRKSSAAPPVTHALDDLDREIWQRFGAERLGMATATVWRAMEMARPKRPLVALSGGKDSLVTLAIVRSVLPTVEVLWTDDELEYAETVAHIERLEREWELDLTVRLSPATHAGWFRPWSARPYWREPRPDAIASDGVATRKWQAGRGHDLVFTGLRAQESRRRSEHLRLNGPIYRTSHGWRACPLWDWSADEVWAYIAGRELPYNPVYDRLATIGVERDKQRVGPLPLARGADLAAGWPDMWSRLIKRYGSRWRE